MDRDRLPAPRLSNQKADNLLPVPDRAKNKKYDDRDAQRSANKVLSPAYPLLLVKLRLSAERQKEGSRSFNASLPSSSVVQKDKAGGPCSDGRDLVPGLTEKPLIAWKRN